jgi:hypothetical protein
VSKKLSLDELSKLAYPVNPVEAGVQNPSENLDCGFRRNDDQAHFDDFEVIT